MITCYNCLFIARVSLSLATLMALAAIGSAQVSCPIGGCPVDPITTQDVQSGTPIQADSPRCEFASAVAVAVASLPVPMQLEPM